MRMFIVKIKFLKIYILINMLINKIKLKLFELSILYFILNFVIFKKKLLGKCIRKKFV